MPGEMTAKSGRIRWGALAILVVAIGFVVVVLSMLFRVEPIEVTQSLLKQDGGTVFVEGRVKNTGPDARTVNLDVRYFDGHGRQIAEDRVALGSLRRDAQVSFRSPARELPDARDVTIYIDRGRNPYGN